jgi:hypothetical protein
MEVPARRKRRRPSLSKPFGNECPGPWTEKPLNGHIGRIAAKADPMADLPLLYGRFDDAGGSTYIVGQLETPERNIGEYEDDARLE